MTTWSTYGVGAVTSAEAYTILSPKFRPTTPRYPVIFCHGSGGDSTWPLTATASSPSAKALVDAIVNAGFTILSCDLGGPQSWGNDTAIARITDAYTYSQTLPGVRTGKAILFGGSMGGCNAMVWAATGTNATKVAGLYGLIPVCDLSDIVTNNRSGYAATVNGCYSGGWSEATYGAAHNPITMATAGKLSTVPALIYYGADDLVCYPPRTAALITASGAEGHSVSGGHDATFYTNVDIPHSVAWMLAHS